MRYPIAMSITFILVLLLSSLSCQSDKNEPPGDDRGSTPEAKTMAIEDVTWQLADVGGKPAEPVPADARAAHLRLNSKEKRVSGFGGVNTFNGSYEHDGTSLRFGQMMMTRMAGPEPLMTQEDAFSKALNSTTSYRVSGGTLELLDNSGNVLATLKRRPTSSTP